MALSDAGGPPAYSAPRGMFDDFQVFVISNRRFFKCFIDSEGKLVILNEYRVRAAF